MQREMTAAEAVSSIRSGEHVFLGSGCAEPQTLVRAMVARSRELTDVEVFHLLTLGEAPYASPEHARAFRHNAFFIGANVRGAVRDGRADYTPVFLSEIPSLFRRGLIPVDTALIQVSAPDRHGFCSLGVSVDVVKAAVERAGRVVAEVNPSMPRTHGDSFLPASRIDAFVRVEGPILELPAPSIDPVSDRIGRFVASLVEDGATLQMGIGGIPNATLAHLRDRTDLGIHTEMFSDGVLSLVESGALTCSRKSHHPGKVISSFCMGTRKLYDFVDDNPFFEFRPSEYTNDPFIIARNDRMIAINSALQVDLTGQVCADSLGTLFYSGIGGQVDFVRGAARAKGGKPVIALSSTAKDGTISRIVPVLEEGAGVVTTRGDVHYVVTEFGIAELHGRSIRERALALIGVAHPDHRGELLAAARARHYVSVDEVPTKGRPYPVEMEETITLKNALRARCRPVRPADERLVRDLFYLSPEETVYLTYGRPLRDLDREHVQRLCTPDYDNRLALVVLVEEDDSERVVAMGQYERDRSTNLAEVVFTVRGDLQNRGIGRHLLTRLMEDAEKRGIRGFRAKVQVDNTRMLHILHRHFSPVHSELEDGFYVITVDFEEVRKSRRTRDEKTARETRRMRLGE